MRKRYNGSICLDGTADRSNYCDITEYLRELTDSLDAASNAAFSGDILYDRNSSRENLGIKGALERSYKKAKFAYWTANIVLTLVYLVMLGFIMLIPFLSAQVSLKVVAPFALLLLILFGTGIRVLSEHFAYGLTFNPLMKNVLTYSRNHREYDFYVDGLNCKGFFIRIGYDSEPLYVSFDNLGIKIRVDEELSDPVFIVKRNTIKEVVLPSYDRWHRFYEPVWEYYDVRDTKNNRIYV